MKDRHTGLRNRPKSTPVALTLIILVGKPEFEQGNLFLDIGSLQADDTEEVQAMTSATAFEPKLQRLYDWILQR